MPDAPRAGDSLNDPFRESNAPNDPFRESNAPNAALACAGAAGVRTKAVVWAGVGVGLAVLAALVVMAGDGLVDLQVYRAGGDAVLRGLPLYGPDFPYTTPALADLPFTYPPFAALLFAPFGLLSWPVSMVVMTVIGALALCAACVITARVYLPLASALPVGAGLAVVCVFLEPMRANITFGQINLVLMLLVVADCLLPRTPWPRGLLIGIAAAIKLTPAAFVLFFLVRKQWKPILMALGGFFGATAAAFLVLPSTSVQYWTFTVFSTERIGSVIYGDNQSLRGLHARMQLDWYWLPIAAVLVIAATWFVAYKLRDRALPSLLIVATGALLASPVSWEHHWSWVAPALVGVAIVGWQRRNWWGALVLLPFALGLYRFARRGGGVEVHWTITERVIGEAYVYTGLAVLIAFVVSRRLRA
ncbi:glycosyltransferase 87 family protein [Allokutzneria sp. A3M-2-11 16]|uniref:glycosyltransferase 87 family protein n=1 Tax=Allokutzneria sp. A3M-2-11 16 TaxID=2962043 RepID=UPI0020B7106B|nr:glycosyltransferase 87 family protein [Allokutzneria sp. A3M-2-11 16]MCP3801447.1 glycosyltransferase 87 family protein [Allokutzneria sp. A3M-2-11 16]